MFVASLHAIPQTKDKQDKPCTNVDNRKDALQALVAYYSWFKTDARSNRDQRPASLRGSTRKIIQHLIV